MATEEEQLGEVADLSLGEALAVLAAAGRRHPCHRRPEWTSEQAEDRRIAADLCEDCPVSVPCLSAGVDLGAAFGVWGGKDLGAPAVRRAVRRKHPQATVRAAPVVCVRCQERPVHIKATAECSACYRARLRREGGR